MGASCFLTMGGCSDRPIIDDFGISGYARIEGSVRRADGTPLANAGVAFLCGPDSPDGFGSTVSTDGAGHYFVDIDAPGPLIIPPSGLLRCRLSAPGNAPPIVSVETSVRFSESPDSRPLTIVDLIEPQPVGAVAPMNDRTPWLR
jgi:hypothetical protein